MNINGITSGIEEAKTAGGVRPREVDLTVSDRGVQPNKRADATRAVDVPSQITSTAVLQAELTEEETLSLVQYFGSQDESAAENADRQQANTYNLSGRNAGQGFSIAHGRLVDWIG